MKNFIESENYTYNKMAETNLKTSSCNIEMMLNNLLIDEDYEQTPPLDEDNLIKDYG